VARAGSRYALKRTPDCLVECSMDTVANERRGRSSEDIMFIEINPAHNREGQTIQPPANHTGLSRCRPAPISSSGTTGASAKSASGYKEFNHGKADVRRMQSAIAVLADPGKDGKPAAVVAKTSQESLARDDRHDAPTRRLSDEQIPQAGARRLRSRRPQRSTARC